MARRRAPNDPLQYDDLALEWWAPRGAFAALHWLAAARAELVPAAARPGAVLVDVACGGGLLGPHIAGKGYRHVGVDIGMMATRVARLHDVTVVRGDVTRLPLASAVADVVVAGEIFEHVRDLDGVIAEIGRVLRPGGLLVCDTLANTRLCRFLLVTVGERLPVVPAGIHDPALFVDPSRLEGLCAASSISLATRGLRPSILHVLAWLAHLRSDVAMREIGFRGVVYQGVGVKSQVSP